MSQTGAPTHEQVDGRIARAMDGVKELLKSNMETIGAELKAINQRLDSQARVQDDVEDLKIRVTAMEAFKSSQEQRLGEARAYRRIHLPSLALALGGLLLGAAGLLASLL